jgi:hypothetical protein
MGGVEWIDAVQGMYKMAGHFECGYKNSGYVKFGEFIE